MQITIIVNFFNYIYTRAPMKEESKHVAYSKAFPIWNLSKCEIVRFPFSFFFFQFLRNTTVIGWTNIEDLEAGPAELFWICTCFRDRNWLSWNSSITPLTISCRLWWGPEPCPFLQCSLVSHLAYVTTNLNHADHFKCFWKEVYSHFGSLTTASLLPF